MVNELTLEQIEASKRIINKYRIQDEKPLDQALMIIKDLYAALADLRNKKTYKKIGFKRTYKFFNLFTRMRNQIQRKGTREINNAFKAFDKTNKDYLTYDEQKVIISDHGPRIYSENADDLLKELGLELNRKFKYSDFVIFNLQSGF